MSHNAWANPSLAGSEDVARMAEFLEERSQRPDQLQVNQAVCAAVSPQPGERLLDLGSGTGALSRLVAPQVKPDGSIAGLDISLEFNLFARRILAEMETANIVNLLTGQAERLPFEENCFDGAWGARLLLHATQPDAIVSEMKRVVRPGGRVVLADWDFDTIAIDHPDRELTRRLIHWRTDNHGGNNWSGRQLLARAQDAGLKDIEVKPLVIVARDERPALTPSLYRAAEVARDGSGISAEEHDVWVEELKSRIRSGKFLASIVYFIVKGYV